MGSRTPTYDARRGGTGELAARWDRSVEISGSLVAALVAAVFLGPGAAFAVVVVAESVAWAVERLRPIALPQNLVGLGAPALAAAHVMDAVVPGGASEGAIFYLAFAGVSLGAFGLNVLIVGGIHLIHDGGGAALHPRILREMLPVWAVNIGLTVAIA